MNIEENYKINVPEKFINNFHIPDNLVYTDLNENESNEDYELFRAPKIRKRILKHPNFIRVRDASWMKVGILMRFFYPRYLPSFSPGRVPD